MSCCDNKIVELEDDLKNVEIKSKNIKQEYLNLLNINLQKDLTIRKIKQSIEQSIESNKFTSFGADLSEDCLLKLRLIGNSQAEDSKFVSVALNSLYNDSIQIVKAKCLSNRSKNPEKTSITPEKKTLLERIFAERLSYISSVDKLRKNSLGKLIRNAIDSATQKNPKRKNAASST